ncbi:MAG: hypothetical protein HY316_06395 [Acidobacteria bacterium]|nr:hypothetical protein [Acidobacteriota bacterium]
MLRRLLLGCGLVLGVLAPSNSLGQIINSVVGKAINDNRPALDTPLVRPQGLAIDNSGNLIIADRGQFVIRRVAGGTATVIAGGGDIFDDAIPVPAKSAGLDYPVFMAVGADGTVYFSDYNDARVRKITPGGLVTTVAGTGYYGYYGDGGKATLADLSNPTGVALDRTRNLLYISDSSNSVVRRVNLTTGIIETVAGTGVYGYSGDGGPGVNAQLNYPWGLAVDAAGNLYIADADPITYLGLIRKLSVGGTISTLVPSTAGLDGPTALAFDPFGNLYVADYWNYQVVRVGSGGSLTTYAGGGEGSFLPLEDVPATSEFLFRPYGLAFDASGNLYVSEAGWNIVRRVDAATGRIRTVAGSVANVLDGGPAISAPLAYPFGLAMSAAGDLYIADLDHQRIRKATPGGTISTVAGNGVAYSAPDGVLSGNFNTVDYPIGLSLDSSGTNLYFTEAFTVVRKLNLATRQLTTVAGRPYDYGYSGDNGPATSAQLADPIQAIVASSGDVYISDRNNNCIRRVRSGIITTVAGICVTDTNGGYSGDGGPATQAQLSYPMGLAFDRNGDLLIADSGNSIVRRLSLSTGIITRVAGIPRTYGYSGDLGSPLRAELGSPAWLAVDQNGTLFISDEYNSAIRVVRAGVIDTLAGIGYSGFAGDGGEARFAWLSTPEGLALDGSGNLYFADADNNRVRKITLAGLTPPTLSVTPASLSFRVTQDGEPPPARFLLIRNTGSGFLNWQFDLRLPPAGSGTFTGGPWLYLSNFEGGSAPTLVEVSVDPSDVPPGTHQGQVVIISPGSNNATVTIPLTLTVDPPVAPLVSLSTREMYYEAVQGGAAPASKILSITNSGSGSLSWQASSTTFRGGNWLTLSRASGTTQAGGTASTIAVAANPANLSPGFYVGIVTVTNLDDGSPSSVLVGLSVGSAGGSIFLTSSSFVFYAVQGSNYVPSQITRVLNTGQGIMTWQVQSSVSEGNWLRVSPASGSSDAANLAASPSLTISVDPVGLSPGDYGGYLSVHASGARNTPQLASVILRVLPPGSPPIGQVQPKGLVFSATTGSAPQSQEVTVQTTSGGTLNFVAGTRTQDGATWLTATPTAGSLTSSTDRPRIRVQVSPGTLPAGVYRGSVTVSFSDGTVCEVAVVMIVREPGATSQSFGGVAQGCSPNQQVIISTRLGNNFALPTGWPTTVIAAVTTNCGDPINNSTVAASFSNGDSTILLQNQGGGVYSRDWVPSKATGSSSIVQVTMRALNPALPEASLQLVGTLSADNTNPVVNDGGVVNGASFTANRPVSPGGIVSIYGSNLASGGSCFGGNCSTGLPLPPTLGGVSVRVGGFTAPLFYAGPGQINAQLPAELSGVTSADVVVTARGLVSAPRTIQVDANQPGIFTIDGTRGAILISNSDFLAAPTGSVPGRNARPAPRGQFITIYCTGLGPVNNSPPSGYPASGDPLSRTNTPVSVTIGGVAASNIGFAGLSPGFVGLYQVDVQVPADVTPGAAVSLKITQNGVDSNQVTVAIE